MVNENYKGIIYKATCLINDKIYFGQTINSLNDRIKGHKKGLKQFNNNTKFSNALRKHGFNNFNWEIVEEHQDDTKELLINKLNERETFYILKFKTHLIGYNIRSGGNNSPLREESKQKIREFNLGKKLSIKTKDLIRQKHIGVLKTENHKNKIRESHIGLKPSKESLTKNSESNKNSKKYKCEYCKLITNGGNYNRWHGKKCKYK